MNKCKIVKWTTFLVLILALALSLGDSAMRVRGSGSAAAPTVTAESGITARTLPREVGRGVARGVARGAARESRPSRRGDFGSALIAPAGDLGALDAADALNDTDYDDAVIGDAINGAAVIYSESAFASGGAGGNTYPLYSGAGIIGTGGSGSGGSGGGSGGGGGGVILPPATTTVGAPEPSSLILLCAGLLTLFVVARRIGA